MRITKINPNFTAEQSNKKNKTDYLSLFHEKREIPQI